MWSFPFGNKHTPIAIDLGADSIKLLQMRKMGGRLSVSACARWRLPESAHHDAAKRKELAVCAVREILKREGFRGRWAISALSCEQLSIKSVRLPHLPEDELAEAVQWEAKERFGFDVGPGQLRYLNAGQVRQGAETRDEVIIMAAPREEVELHLEMLSQMGLVPQHIDAQPVALFRVFERFLRRQADAQAVSVIVDLGKAATRVVVARGRQIVFVKSVDIGGRKFTEATAKQLNLSYEEADELRIRAAREHLEGSGSEAKDQRPDQPGGANSLSWAVRDAMRSEVENLGRELALCLRYCAVTFRGLRADRVTLTGGEAYDSAVAGLFKEQLKIECVLGHPLRGIDCSAVDFGSDRRGTLAEWAACTGLAMRNADAKDIGQEADHGEHRLSA